MRVGLIGCVKSKQSKAAPAHDLYTSALFVGRRRWVEATCDRWFILSAKHGLIEPDELLEPYDAAMMDVSRPQRRSWSERVLADLHDRLHSSGDHTFEIHADADYCDWGLVEGLEKTGATVVRPMAGLAFGGQLSRYAEGSGVDTGGSQSVDDAVADGLSRKIPSRGSSAAPPASRMAERREALSRFHLLLDELADRLGGARNLADATGPSGWPPAGVYFFFERGEVREESGRRVVRIGTHALTETSKTTLWSRLRAHRGTMNGGGNHRSSIFRLHVGTALLARDQHPEAAATWGRGSIPRGEANGVEQGLEHAVSDHIGRMPFLWLAVGDRMDRGAIEVGAIALLSNHGRPAIDPASSEWLGNDADRPLVRSSHLWNVNHTQESWHAGFLDRLQVLVRAV